MSTASGELSASDVDLVQQTFEKVKPIGNKAAEMFYGRLFEIAPEVRPLFKGDMAEQGRKLIATLAVVVGSLHSLATILPAVSALAKKHVNYGVTPKHYESVGAALLWALERGLGAAWTPQVAAAWTGAYTTLSRFMISEAYGASLKPAS